MGPPSKQIVPIEVFALNHIDYPSGNDTDKVRKIKIQKRDFSTLPPVITNQKINAASVECSSPPGEEFMSCSFSDQFGVSRTIPNIAFVNYEVKNPLFTSYKSQNNAVVNRVDFSSSEMCEVMGHNRNGLTLKCGGSTYYDGKYVEGGEERR